MGVGPGCRSNMFLSLPDYGEERLVREFAVSRVSPSHILIEAKFNSCGLYSSTVIH